MSFRVLTPKTHGGVVPSTFPANDYPVVGNGLLDLTDGNIHSVFLDPLQTGEIHFQIVGTSSDYLYAWNGLNSELNEEVCFTFKTGLTLSHPNTGNRLQFKGTGSSVKLKIFYALGDR